MTVFPRILELLAERGAKHIHVSGGGIIPERDIPRLTEMGVGKIFGPGTDTRDVIEYVNSLPARHA